jgi:hypothetical protein
VLRPLLGDPVAGYTVRGTASADAYGVRQAADGSLCGDGKAGDRQEGFATEDGSREARKGYEYVSGLLHGECGTHGCGALSSRDRRRAATQLLWG